MIDLIAKIIGYMVMGATGIGLAAMMLYTSIDYAYRQMHCANEFLAFLRARQQSDKKS